MSSFILEQNRKKIIMIGIIMIIFGASGFILPLIGYRINDVNVPEMARAELPTFEEQKTEPLPANVSSQSQSSANISEKSLAASSKYGRPEVKDRLIISKINVDMPVFTGDSESILNKGGWLYPYPSTPEEGGNSVIFGHRYKYLPPISNTLYNLDKVNVGDEVVLFWHGKKYTYKVFEKKIIEPTDLSVLNPTKDNRITIITCTPLFTTKQRLVIVGSLVEAL